MSGFSRTAHHPHATSGTRSAHDRIDADGQRLGPRAVCGITIRRPRQRTISGSMAHERRQEHLLRAIAAVGTSTYHRAQRCRLRLFDRDNKCRSFDNPPEVHGSRSRRKGPISRRALRWSCPSTTRRSDARSRVSADRQACGCVHGARLRRWALSPNHRAAARCARARERGGHGLRKAIGRVFVRPDCTDAPAKAGH